MSKTLSATYVATCDEIIENYCKGVGLDCVMTGDHHVRCSTRTAEALLKIEAATGKKADIVVMVQGDEPMVRPEMIDAAVAPMLTDPSINVVNLMADMDTLEEFEDPNEVKVVVDRFNDALYFSREPIPSRKKGSDKVPMRKQVCIIPFRRDYLLRFNEMDESPLEIYESVDMMRILEYGEKVRMAAPDLERHYRAFLQAATVYATGFDKGLEEEFYASLRLEMNNAALQGRAAYNEFVRAANQAR
jgi:CMP-2-keto-3-deoxyoctulosonic acid synthetase